MYVFRQLTKTTQCIPKYNHQGVSLIVCSKNELLNLQKNIQLWLNQQYPEFELIIVDDHSTDGSLQWLHQQSMQSKIFKVLSCPPEVSGKKQALALGVQKANYPWICVTDADCSPASSHWLEHLADCLKNDKEIVLAYAPYHTRSGWLNKMIRFEALLNMLQTGGAALLGKAYAATGRNMMYLHSIFDLQALLPELPYGDDDFLIQHKATATNTALCLHPESFVYTEPKKTYLHYFLQKWRHYASSKKYSHSSKFYLLAFYTSLIGFYIAFFVAIWKGDFLFASFLFISKLLVCWPVFCKTCRLLRESGLCLYYPLLEIIYLLHLCMQLPFLTIKKKNW